MDIKEQYENGQITATEAFVIVNQKIKQLEALKNELYDNALEEAREFNKGEKYYGVVWEIRSGKTTYDFEKDNEYKSLNDQLKNRRKLLTAACKSAQNNIGTFNADSGEEITIVPIKSIARDTLVFKEVD